MGVRNRGEKFEFVGTPYQRSSTSLGYLPCGDLTSEDRLAPTQYGTFSSSSHRVNKTRSHRNVDNAPEHSPDAAKCPRRLPDSQRGGRGRSEPLSCLHEVRFSRGGTISMTLLLKCLQRVDRLRRLTLQSCEIAELEEICRCTRHVEYADLSWNAIRLLPSRIASLWTFLTDLNLAQNRLCDFEELQKLVSLLRLKKLNLSENPISSQVGYRSRVITSMPQLFELDMHVISVETRREAALQPLNDRVRAVAEEHRPWMPPSVASDTLDRAFRSGYDAGSKRSADLHPMAGSRTAADRQYEELMSKIRASNGVSMSEVAPHLGASPPLVGGASSSAVPSAARRSGGGSGTRTPTGSTSALYPRSVTADEVLEQAQRILEKTEQGYITPVARSSKSPGGSKASTVPREVAFQREQHSRSPLGRRQPNESLRGTTPAASAFASPTLTNTAGAATAMIGRRGLFDHSPVTRVMAQSLYAGMKAEQREPGSASKRRVSPDRPLLHGGQNDVASAFLSSIDSATSSTMKVTAGYHNTTSPQHVASGSKKTSYGGPGGGVLAAGIIGAGETSPSKLSGVMSTNFAASSSRVADVSASLSGRTRRMEREFDVAGARHPVPGVSEYQAPLSIPSAQVTSTPPSPQLGNNSGSRSPPHVDRPRAADARSDPLNDSRRAGSNSNAADQASSSSSSRRRIFRSLPPTTRVPRRPPATVPSSLDLHRKTFWQEKQEEREREMSRRADKERIANVDRRHHQYHQWLSDAFQVDPGRRESASRSPPPSQRPNSGGLVAVAAERYSSWDRQRKQDYDGDPAGASTVPTTRAQSHASAGADGQAHPFYPPYRQTHTEPEIRTWFDKSLEERKYHEDEAKLEALRVLQLKLPLNPKNLPIGVEEDDVVADRDKLTSKTHIADILLKVVEKCEGQHRVINCMYKHLAIPRDWMIQNATKASVSKSQASIYSATDQNQASILNTTTNSAGGAAGQNRSKSIGRKLGYAPKMIITQPGMSAYSSTGKPMGSTVSQQDAASRTSSPQKLPMKGEQRFDAWSLYASLEHKGQSPREVNLRKFKYPRRQFGGGGPKQLPNSAWAPQGGSR
ncbi:unnamed protein product [Amoebophrya sp. A25]|nr:unnamed protein product [Amoebophrya sp. A25]|eukprot:GSA25T00002071001.1